MSLCHICEWYLYVTVWGIWIGDAMRDIMTNLTHIHELYHKSQWAESHVWIRRVACMNTLRAAGQFVRECVRVKSMWLLAKISRSSRYIRRISTGSRAVHHTIKESLQWMCHGTRRNESRHMDGWVMVNKWRGRMKESIAHMIDSCHTLIDSCHILIDSCHTLNLPDTCTVHVCTVQVYTVDVPRDASLG